MANEPDVPERWRSWIDKIYSDVGDLVYHRRIWFRIGDVIQWNDNLPKEHAYYGVLAYWYAHSQALGVRRHVDRSKDVYSLVNLLDELGVHPDLIGVDRLVADGELDRRSRDRAGRCGMADPARTHLQVPLRGTCWISRATSRAPFSVST